MNQVLFPEDCGDEAAGTPAEIAAKEEVVGVAQLDELAAKLNALSLPPEEIAPLSSIALRAAKRIRSLEKGWNICQKRRHMQAQYLGQINDLYHDDFHIIAMPMLGEEVRGVERLQKFAELLLKGNRSDRKSVV